MNIPNLSKLNGLVSIGKTFLATHRPEILLGMSVTSTVGAVVMAAKGGYKSGQEVLRAEYSDLDLINPEGKAKELDVKEKIQLTWLNYLPAAGLTAGALGSTTALHFVHVQEKKAIATAALAAVDEVKRNIIVTSEEENQKLFESRADEEGTAVIQNGDGEVEELFLVRDPITGRDIWSNKTRIEEAMLEVGNMVNGSENASLNNFYEQAGYGRVDDGDLRGWSGVLPSISWTDENGMPISGVRDDGRPFRGFRFRPNPEAGYDNTYR